MENEIELKIMLSPDNLTLIETWLAQQHCLEHRIDFLGNTYYDSPELDFAKQHMGLRVRRCNQQHEMTLKMQGDIIGGLHQRPEYNLPLPNALPNLHALTSHFQFALDDSLLQATLHPVFSTDFERKTWRITQNQSEIEVALDQGIIKNTVGEEAICEVEFELKSGKLSDLFTLLNQMPTQDGMWLSSLSKAQRGYWVGKTALLAESLFFSPPCHGTHCSYQQQYQALQQLADAIRLSGKTEWITRYNQLSSTPITAISELFSAAYLRDQLVQLQRCFAVC